MPGPRDYTTGTEHALFALSQLTCYFPGCDTDVVVLVEGEPIVNVEIAHIRGAKPGSPRYDFAMTDDERRAFANLILMCKPHHNWVDRLHPDEYSPEVLQGWKIEREQGKLSELGSLPALTEERFIELLEAAFTASAPQRVVSVELALGVVNPGGLITVPPERYSWLKETNPDLGEQVMSVTARNRGTLQAYVESYKLCFEPVGSKLMGHNHFAIYNPPLPKRLEGGEAATWMTRLVSVRALIAGHLAIGRPVERVAAEIYLSSGETITSTDAIPAPTFVE